MLAVAIVPMLTLLSLLCSRLCCCHTWTRKRAADSPGPYSTVLDEVSFDVEMSRQHFDVQMARLHQRLDSTDAKLEAVLKAVGGKAANGVGSASSGRVAPPVARGASAPLPGLAIEAPPAANTGGSSSGSFKRSAGSAASVKGSSPLRSSGPAALGGSKLQTGDAVAPTDGDSSTNRGGQSARAPRPSPLKSSQTKSGSSTARSAVVTC